MPDLGTFIEILNELAVLLEIAGDSPFKVRAYRRVAEELSSVPRTLEELVERGVIEKVPGVGRAIADKAREFFATGRVGALEELRKRVPSGLVEVASLPGLGPKTAARIWRETGIADIGTLEKACIEGKIAKLKGFGPKSEERILKAIAEYRENLRRFLLIEAELAAEEIMDLLDRKRGIESVVLSGCARRGMEVLERLELVAVIKGSPPDWKLVLNSPAGLEVGDNRVEFRWSAGLPVVIHLCDRASFSAVLFRTTGSMDHLADIGKRALELGFEFKRGRLLWKGKAVPARSEAQIYKALGLPFIPPELREGRGEVELAAAGRLPRLVDDEDIRGVLHVHTTYSDGDITISKAVEILKSEGYSYLGVCDHSRSARYAGGLSIEDVKKQWAEIDEINSRIKDFKVFKGIESDILPDGSLDYPDDILAGFDFVIASLHGGFSRDVERNTKRLVTAASNPYTTMIGHPTGRLLGARAPYEVDMEKVLDACSVSGCMVEINAHPYRLDLDWRLHQRAKGLGIKLSINPDAHSVDGLTLLRYGIICARKGMLGPADIFNTLSVDEVDAVFKKMKRRKRTR